MFGAISRHVGWPWSFQSRHQVVRHILNDLERFGAKPIDFKAFLDIMTAKMGERDTKEDRNDLINHGTHTKFNL